MSDYIQNLNSLASVTSLSQLKLDGEGQLEKRSALDTLGHRIADAFRSLSAAGRTAISARNVELFSAMQKAVDESTHHEMFLAREAGGRLEAALGRLRNSNRDAYFSQIKNGITGDPRFAKLPKSSQKAFEQALQNMANIYVGAEPSQWKACADSLKWAFFGEQPAGLDLAKGMEKFTESLRTGFLKPGQQKHIKEGFHDLIFTDLNRQCIRQIRDFPTPPGMGDDYYKDALRSVLGDEHKDLMPFVSTVISQNGLGTLAMQLPIESGHDIYRSLLACQTGTASDLSRMDVAVRREGNELVVEARYDGGFRVDGIAGKSVSQLSTATMRIDLAAEPERHVVDGKEVLIPQFRLENVGTAFNNPLDIVKADPRFRALPEYSQEALLHALGSVNPDEARMQRLKDDFFGLSTGDMRKADAEFATELRNEFLKPSQQKHFMENGFFDNFGKDMARGTVSALNGQPVPRGQSHVFYENLFRNALPEEHHQLIPFISMMCSQAGLDSAKVVVPYLSGLLDDKIPQHLMEANLFPPKGTDSHSMSMTIEGARVALKDDFVHRFAYIDKDMWQDGDPIPLAIKGSATMVIDLDGIIDVEAVDGKDVLLPQFHIENSEARFIPGEASYLSAD